MTDHITPQQFEDSGGTEDWRVLGEGACTFFPTGSFAAGASSSRRSGSSPASTITRRPSTCGPTG